MKRANVQIAEFLEVKYYEINISPISCKQKLNNRGIKDTQAKRFSLIQVFGIFIFFVFILQLTKILIQN